MVVALLYAMQSPCNCFTLSLSGSDSRKSNSWWDDNDTTMEIMVSCRWRWWSWSPEDGDQKEKKWYWPYHVTILIACDVYHVSTSYLLRTTVVNKMIPHNNFKKVFPLTVRRCESPLFRSTTWWSGVIDSNVRIQRVLTSLACTDMASEHMQNT